MIKKCIYWLWKNSVDIHPGIILSCIMGILRVCASMLFVWVCKQLVDIATHSSGGNMEISIAMLIIITFLEISLSASNHYLENKNNILLKNKLRYLLFSHLMSSRWSGKERFHSGDMLNRMEEDVRVVSETASNAFPSVWVTIFQLIAAFLFLAYFDIRLACILLVIMPAALAISRYYIKHMRKLTANIRKSDSKVHSHIQENLQHKTLIQTFGLISEIVDKLSRLQIVLYGQTMNRTKFTLFSRTAVMTGFVAGYMIAFIWGTKGLYNGTLSFGVMTAFLQLVGLIQRPVVELSRHIPSFVHSITSVERLIELDELPKEEQGNEIMLTGEAGIRLENVSFAYPDGNKQIIRNFSHDFTPGSRTAIVGETGTGKSTLIRLMLSLLQPQQGNITIYNNTKKIIASALTRCNLVYVPQGNTLLSGTIRDNLMLGNPDATDKQLHEVITIAAAEFVYDLSNGLDTFCGEHGAGLSEGQAQRICIARGLLRPGSILLLDELSSSLDNKTEQLLIERLITQTKGKTLIFITHRKLITQFCEHIIEL